MLQEIILAGGCFWCTEWVFLEQEGVQSVESGYTGGAIENPTYEEVCEGQTGHYEAIKLSYDPERITFLQLLTLFWRHIDPTDAGGQFADRGEQYRTAIFYLDAQQKRWAEESKMAVQKLFSKPITTQILPAAPFYPAEGYHQQYCTKNPGRFHSYQQSHEPYLERLWGTKEEPQLNLREYLTPLQYHVTQEHGTEPPFENTYWDNKEAGVYVDIITGEPLFSSEDKFDSGTGWPSFTRPISDDALEEHHDMSLGMDRVEVRAKKSQAHLGHVFPDGPGVMGLRYCINSAALHFIPTKMLD